RSKLFTTFRDATGRLTWAARAIRSRCVWNVFRDFSRHHEIGALFRREIGAVERGDRGVAARDGLGPRFLRVHRVAAAELFVLDALREHASRRPPPDFATNRIDDDEVVRLSAAEGELDVLLPGICDAEHKMNRPRIDGDIEARVEFRFVPRRRRGATMRSFGD